MKSRFISPRPARLGLLYLFIIGGQCHTRPLMHVAGVLGCCTPVLYIVFHTAVCPRWNTIATNAIKRVYTLCYDMQLVDI